MGGLDVFAKVQSRDELGRFLSRVRRDATRTVEDTTTRTAAMVRAMAPSKTGALRASIQPVMMGATTGAVTVGTNHWKFQNDGTSPHPIHGWVSFWWARQGRPWQPGMNWISHPGNPAVHFVEAGERFAKSYFMESARRNFL